jgi:hypothetical protein
VGWVLSLDRNGLFVSAIEFFAGIEQEKIMAMRNQPMEYVHKVSAGPSVEKNRSLFLDALKDNLQ